LHPWGSCCMWRRWKLRATYWWDRATTTLSFWPTSSHQWHDKVLSTQTFPKKSKFIYKIKMSCLYFTLSKCPTSSHSEHCTIQIEINIKKFIKDQLPLAVLLLHHSPIDISWVVIMQISFSQPNKKNCAKFEILCRYYLYNCLNIIICCDGLPWFNGLLTFGHGCGVGENSASSLQADSCHKPQTTED